MSACRFCGDQLSLTFVDLGLSPLSNSFLNASQLQAQEPVFPLHVFVCGSCFLVQLEEFESPQNIFSDYAYFSSFSDAWLQHAKGYVEEMTVRFKISSSHRVIEIASNDGYLLQYFKEKNVPVLGIEPAANVADVAKKKGIPTLVKFFGVETAQELRSKGETADLLLGNNVLAHVPDINDFVAGLKLALKPSGVITMEFPHLLKLIELNQFDTIYHEHFSYLAFFVVEKIFAKHGLVLFDVEELSTHGGSLRIFARHTENKSLEISERVELMKKKEKAAGLDQIESYFSFQKKADKARTGLLDFLTRCKKDGKQVVGYGAPAKGNTLLNFCGIRADHLPYTVDRSPYKQGRFLPGTHIPIYSPEKIKESKPDYLLILPWNLKEEIMSQMSSIREWGGEFVVPIPALEVL